MKLHTMAKLISSSHVDFIPDGNHRWAVEHGLLKEAGYIHGILPDLFLFKEYKKYKIREISIYCFTQDNTKRPSIQKQTFTEATQVLAVGIIRRGAALLVVSDESSYNFLTV